MDELAERVGRRITQLRREHQMTSEKLAKLVGVGKSHMSQLENGKRRASLTTLEAIAKVFGVDIVALF